MTRTPEMSEGVAEWVASGHENSPEGALQFMRKSVKFSHLRPRGAWIKQLAFAYWRYRNGVIDLTPTELKMLAKHSGVPVCPSEIKQARQTLKARISQTKCNDH